MQMEKFFLRFQRIIPGKIERAVNIAPASSLPDNGYFQLLHIRIPFRLYDFSAADEHVADLYLLVEHNEIRVCACRNASLIQPHEGGGYARHHVYRIGKEGADRLRQTETLTDTASVVLNLYVKE